MLLKKHLEQFFLGQTDVYEHIEIKFESLYGHWINCNDIWMLVDFNLETSSEFPIEWMRAANLYQKFFRLTVAYSLLYVVIEGYNTLRLKDKEIDELLNERKLVNSLKLLRNSIFHYQKNPLPLKLKKFIDDKESAEWARKLRKAFEFFFINVITKNNQ